MAITIQSNPGSYFSVNGDVIFTVVDIVKASDAVTYPDYRYVADVYIGATMVARLKAYPQPDNKIGVFNIGNILRNYIAANFNPSASNLLAQQIGLGEFNIIATIKFGEEYNFTLYTNLTVDTARTYFGHYNGRLIGATTNLAAYTNKAATVRPLTTKINGTGAFNLIPFFSTTTSNVSITVKTYTATGTLIGSVTTAFTPSAANTLQIFNVSYYTVATSPGGYVTAQFNGTGNLYRFDLNCEAKFQIFTIHFLNRFGGFESRDFTKVSRKIIDIEKSEFGKLGYTMDSSGVISYSNSNNVYNETRSVYSSQYKEKMTLNTDIMTDDEYTWLGDLILSPMVYVEQVVAGVSYFLPCAITANNYEFRKTVNDSLTNLTIDIEFGEQFNAQYR